MAKGVDLVGWRSCAKQRELGSKRFAVTLKKLGRQALAGRAMGPQSATAVARTPEQRRRLQQAQEARQALATFDEGTPECPTCPISESKPFGCYLAVDFPIDAVAETALFRYFTSKLEDENSAAFGIYRDLVSKAPSSGTLRHTSRGPTGDLAELRAPLFKEWGFLMWKKRVDSAQLLGSLFFNHTRLGLISVFSVFWDGFIEHARASTPSFDASPSLVQPEALSEFLRGGGAGGTRARTRACRSSSRATPRRWGSDAEARPARRGRRRAGVRPARWPRSWAAMTRTPFRTASLSRSSSPGPPAAPALPREAASVPQQPLGRRCLRRRGGRAPATLTVSPGVPMPVATPSPAPPPADAPPGPSSSRAAAARRQGRRLPCFAARAAVARSRGGARRGARARRGDPVGLGQGGRVERQRQLPRIPEVARRRGRSALPPRRSCATGSSSWSATPMARRCRAAR